MKILDKVTFNDGLAYVLSESPKLIYTKYKTCIIGTDGTFYECYSYGVPTERWKAFGGRKFSIELSDGSIEECYGQWWSGLNSEAVQIIGHALISVTANSLESLKGCYVYFGYMAHPEKFADLVKHHKGIEWGYHDYNALISSNKRFRRRRLTRNVLKTYRNQILKSKTIFSK